MVTFLTVLVIYLTILDHIDLKRRKAKFDKEWEEAHKDDFKEY